MASFDLNLKCNVHIVVHSRRRRSNGSHRSKKSVRHSSSETVEWDPCRQKPYRCMVTFATNSRTHCPFMQMNHFFFWPLVSACVLYLSIYLFDSSINSSIAQRSFHDLFTFWTYFVVFPYSIHLYHHLIVLYYLWFAKSWNWNEWTKPKRVSVFSFPFYAGIGSII